MSSRHSRPSHLPPSSRITDDDQINELLSKLQALISRDHDDHSNDRANSAKVLQEACSCIRSLHSEVDYLSERLSELLDTPADHSGAQAAIIRSLLM